MSERRGRLIGYPNMQVIRPAYKIDVTLIQANVFAVSCAFSSLEPSDKKDNFYQIWGMVGGLG